MRSLLSRLSLVAALALITSSCSGFKSAVYAELEVAPGKKAFLKLAYDKEMSLLVNGKVVALGKTDTYYEPVSIMEHEGLIYLIMHDWRGARAVDNQLMLYRQSGDKMERIKPTEFPRNIAVENFFLPGGGIERRDDGSIRMNNLKIAQKRDVDDPNFRRSMTAHIWHHIETGNPFHETYGSGGGMVEAAFLKSYMEKYKPVMLEFKEMKSVTAKEAGF
jgi:hypothetical protein